MHDVDKDRKVEWIGLCIPHATSSMECGDVDEVNEGPSCELLHPACLKQCREHRRGKDGGNKGGFIPTHLLINQNVKREGAT